MREHDPSLDRARLLRRAAAIGVALLLTVLIGLSLFALLGQPPLAALSMFFVAPLGSLERISELCVKATPLMLMGLGLSFCFRANVWNIGAEGQFVSGAICAGGVALCADESSSSWFVLLVLLAGALGGALWAAPCAFLRTRFHASEILVSLMLVYVAELALGYLVSGPWRDPQGFNFPQTITFVDASRLPPLFSRYRVHVGTPLALLLCALGSIVLGRTFAGFKLALAGLAPPAARYAGISETRTIWAVLSVSGACAGLAGASEVAGPLGQLTPYVPSGYGFTAIIVALVARLSPLGVIPASLLLSMFALGGELSQSRLGLPKSISSVFQGVLLLALLACDALSERDLRADLKAFARRIKGPRTRMKPSEAAP